MIDPASASSITDPAQERESTSSQPPPLDSWGPDADLAIVGRPMPRIEGPEKVTGRARYACDIRLPNQLYARILRSPHPHARIRHISTARAAALPGVHAVLSSADTAAKDMDWYQNSKLFDEKVRFVGDEVAAVAAESEEIAEDALRLIEVAYEQLPAVFEMEAALAPQAPQIHTGENVVDEPEEYTRGDVEAGLQQADVVIDKVYTTQTALHNSLEPHGCTAHWQDDQLTIWESTQGIFSVREEVAQKLGLPEHRVRIIKQHMGGGFGAKQIAWKQTVIAALLSKLSGRPVQLMLDRTAENLAVGNRNATVQHVRIGATKEGTLTAIDLDARLAVGAYMVGGEASNVSGIYQRLYKCDNVRTRQVGVYINAGPSVAFRAPGYVEGAFGLESALDELAHELGLDPLDLRLRNYADVDQKNTQPYSDASAQGLRYCYARATDTFGWRTYSHKKTEGRVRRGIGIAAHEWGGAGNPPGYAWIKLNSDGGAELITGAQDIGTGTRTGMTQVAAEELGLPVNQISVRLGDTGHGPYAPTSAGSATQATMGPAIRAAAADVKRQLLLAAADMLEVEPDELSVRNGVIVVTHQPQKQLTVTEVTQNLAPEMLQGFGAHTESQKEQSVRTFGVQCIEVEVDTETGLVTILRIVAAHDCGRIINPTLVDSQVIGAVTQGIGFALTEERIIDHQCGIVLNANLEEYKVPTIADIPEIVHAHVDIPDLDANSTGAKGIGEPPLVPTAPAIANAIFDATGVRLRSSPLSRSRLIQALSDPA